MQGFIIFEHELKDMRRVAFRGIRLLAAIQPQLRETMPSQASDYQTNLQQLQNRKQDSRDQLTHSINPHKHETVSVTRKKPININSGSEFLISMVYKTELSREV